MTMPKMLKDQLKGFVPTEKSKEIMGLIAKGSTLMRLCKTMPMKSDEYQFSLWADTPSAYWVGEGERIQTTEATWILPKMVAKKIAVIIPVTKEKLNDATINVFEELKPAIAEAFYTTFDKAGLFGVGSPFALNLFQAAIDEGNFIIDGTSTALDLDVSDTMAMVEDGDFTVNGFTTYGGMKNRIRKLRDADGNKLFVDVNQGEFYGEPISFCKNGAFDKAKAELIAGDWNKAVIGIREGIEYEILKEATLQNTLWTDGKPLSLAEQDMIAIKATMRLAFLPVQPKAFAVLATKGTTPKKTGEA